MKLLTFVFLTLALCCSGCVCTSNCVSMAGNWHYSMDIGDGDVAGNVIFNQANCSFSGVNNDFIVRGEVNGNEIRMTFVWDHQKDSIRRLVGSYYDSGFGADPGVGRVYGIYETYDGRYGNFMMFDLPE